MAKRIAITIAGAVSLGSYEAGVFFEILDALAQHNQWVDKNGRAEDRIEIDVLTGASAGGMTAAIAAYSLLFNGVSLVRPYENSLYQAWIKDIDITGLLARGPKEDITHSVLSSDCVIDISRKYLTPNTPLKSPLPDPHPALSRDGKLHLGFALSNLNGIDYARHTMTKRNFTYTRHADRYLTNIERTDGYQYEKWETIRATAVSCGAFPIAFRVQGLIRNIKEFLSSPYLVKELWQGNESMEFAYTDGGVFQNEPLGIAKNLVERVSDGRITATDRGYLFIAPKPKTSDAKLGFSKDKANYKETIFRLGGAVLGQAEFHDWIMAESINDKIALLDVRANQLIPLFSSHRLNPNITIPVTTTLLEAFFRDGENVRHDLLNAARNQLRQQYKDEYSSLNNTIADAWLDAVLVLELAADLHDKEEMYIYDFVADPTRLAGGQLFSFIGFFDEAYRKHDYDYGRSVAQQQILAFMAQGESIFDGLHWTPQEIDPINPAFDNLPMSNVNEGKRNQVYTQLMDAVDDLLKEIGANCLERKVVKTFLIKKYIKHLLAL